MSFPLIDWATGAVFVLDRGDVYISNVEQQYFSSTGKNLFTKIDADHELMQLPSWETAFCARHAKLFYIHTYKTVHEVQIVYNATSGKVEAKSKEFDFANVHISKDYPMQFDGITYSKMQKTGIVVDPVTCRVYVHDRKSFVTFDPSKNQIFPEKFYELPSNFRVTGHNQVQIHENYMYIHVYDVTTRQKSIIRVSLTEPNRIYTDSDKTGRRKGSRRRRRKNKMEGRNLANNSTGTPYKIVLEPQVKLNEMKIIHPEHNWDSHFCHESCDQGRFCVAAMNKKIDISGTKSIENFQDFQAKGICICGDETMCSDSDPKLNFDRYCGVHAAEAQSKRNDMMNIVCVCQKGWSGRRCDLKDNEKEDDTVATTTTKSLTLKVTETSTTAEDESKVKLTPKSADSDEQTSSKMGSLKIGVIVLVAALAVVLLLAGSKFTYNKIR